MEHRQPHVAETGDLGPTSEGHIAPARSDLPLDRPAPIRLRPRPYFSTAVLAVATVLMLLLPYVSGPYLVGLVTLVLVFSIVNIAWNLLLGYGGVFSFGQLGFFAVGGYTAANLDLHTALPLWVSIPAAAAVGGLVGLAIGIPSLRLYGPYMVLFTLAFQLSLSALVTTDSSRLTGGAGGLGSLQSIEFWGLDRQQATLYVGVLLFLLTYGGVAFLLRSPLGLALQAVRDSREAAEARGVNLFRHRVALFTISAFLTALSGAFYAHYVGVIVPTVLGLGLLLSLLAMLVLGGIGTQAGPVVGTLVLVYLNDRLSSTEEYRQAIWGALIVVVALLLPGGLVGTASGLFGRARSFVEEWMQEGSPPTGAGAGDAEKETSAEGLPPESAAVDLASADSSQEGAQRDARADCAGMGGPTGDQGGGSGRGILDSSMSNH
ncbi:MAG: branched-chain amino acid ABC transporter permease [Thermoleophilia bacterium]|nr:branched-chain amino acid ABC transporter permease [Thermoleophilia bacterium]